MFHNGGFCFQMMQLLDSEPPVGLFPTKRMKSSSSVTSTATTSHEETAITSTDLEPHAFDDTLCRPMTKEASTQCCFDIRRFPETRIAHVQVNIKKPTRSYGN